MVIHISPDKTGQFTTITDALASIPDTYTDKITIYIHKGVYKEQVVITHPGITFIGDSQKDTVLTYDLSANMMMDDGMKRGTFRTYSCLIDTYDITFLNLTVANTAGPGPAAAQAIAL